MILPVRPIPEKPVPPPAFSTSAEAIDDAINRGEFQLVYQPKLDVRTKSITSIEALMRWHHPRDGVRMPDTFIGSTEQSGAIGRLTLWAFDRAIDPVTVPAGGMGFPATRAR